MKFRYKLFLLILPIIVVPTAVTTLLSTSYTQRSYEKLEYELLDVKLDLAISRAEEAAETLQKAGLEEVEYYIRQQQQQVAGFLETVDVPGGFMFALRSNGELVGNMLRTSAKEGVIHPDPDLREAISSNSTGRVRYSIASNGEVTDTQIALYRRFSSWDWVFIATVDERIVAEAVNRLRYESALAAGITIALAIGILLVLSRSVARPVRVLMNVTAKVREGDLSARVGTLGKGEFGDLSAFFDGMIGRLQEYAEELESMVERRTVELSEANALLSKRNVDLEYANGVIESKNLHIRQSIAIARRIQHSMLPPIDLLQNRFDHIFVINLPKDELSGDFYWSAQIDSGNLLCLADCMGHGVPGALVTTIAITHLSSIVHDEGVENPGEILTRLHERLTISREDLGGIDMLIMLVPFSSSSSASSSPEATRRIMYASAHRPLFLADEGGVRVEAGDRVAVGSERTPEAYHFSSSELPDQFNGMCYFVSDGLGDQPDGSGRRIGTPGVRDLLSNVYDKPVSSQREDILGYVKTLDPMQRDDITLIGLRIGTESEAE